MRVSNHHNRCKKEAAAVGELEAKKQHKYLVKCSLILSHVIITPVHLVVSYKGRMYSIPYLLPLFPRNAEKLIMTPSPTPLMQFILPH
jgi:hypothetical protein